MCLDSAAHFEQVTSELQADGQQDFLAVEAQLDRPRAKATAVRVRMMDFMVGGGRWCVEVWVAWDSRGSLESGPPTPNGPTGGPEEPGPPPRRCAVKILRPR